jgi:crotonobetainyl-CoA:carnitine CoA-transferase CaiB-like acyl-CoA transferase
MRRRQSQQFCSSVRETGMGRRVDIAMLDAIASLLTFNAGIYFATGKNPRRRGNLHPTISPYETFEAADGWINIGVANDKFWASFCDAIGRSDLVADPRFSSASARVTNRNALVGIIAPVFRQDPRDIWVARLSKAGVPCGAIRAVSEVCEAAQLVSRGMIFQAEHPKAGEIRSLATPFRFDDQPPRAPLPPPLLDQHRPEILRDWLHQPHTGDLSTH